MPRWTENQQRIWIDHIRRKDARQIQVELFERIEAIEARLDTPNNPQKVTKPLTKGKKTTKLGE